MYGMHVEENVDGMDQFHDGLGEEVTITGDIDHFVKEEIVTDWMK